MSTHTTTGVRSPTRALWEITWRCDRRCGHCLVDGGSASPAELSPTQALDVVDQLAALGVRMVSLTGGEPFLRPDWRDLAARVRERGMTLRFAANGHLIDDALAAELVALGTRSVTVSLDGPRDLHDRLRPGPAGDARGSFDRVLAAIARLRPTPIDVVVITSVSRGNLEALDDIHRIVKEAGVDRWVIQLVHPTGRAAAHGDNGSAPIAPADLPRVADFILAHAADPVLAPMAFNHIGYFDRREPILRTSGRHRPRPFWQGCTCGIETVGIEPDGGVKGCANQVGAPFVVGNLRDETLAAIWNDRARWTWIAPRRDQFTGACAKCGLNHLCRAGCTTMAWRATGELFNNPYCLRALEKARCSS